MDNKDKNNSSDFLDEIERDAKKKIKAKDEKEKIFGLGYFGIIGWSIAIPTLLAIALGQYLDKKYPSEFSWTLILIFIGVISGSVNAWHWLVSNNKDND